MKKNHSIIKSIVVIIILLESLFLAKSYSQENSLKYYCKDTINVKEEIYYNGDTAYFPTKSSLSNIRKNFAFVYKDYECTKLLSRWELENDSIFIRTLYHENGQIAKILKIILSDFKYYYEEEYYSNGQLFYKGYYICDTLQTGRVYWSNGKLMRLFYYLYGVAYNNFTEWYEDGQVKIHGQYGEYHLDSIHNWGSSSEMGKWTYFRPNGDVEKEIIYKQDDRTKREILYDLNSVKEKEIRYYSNDEKEKETVYNQKGDIENETNFEQSKPKFIVDSTLVFRVITSNNDTTYYVKLFLYSNVGGLCRIAEDIPCDCRIIRIDQFKNTRPTFKILNNAIRFLWLLIESRINIEIGYFIECPINYHMNKIKDEIKGEVKYLINGETKIVPIQTKDK